MTAMTSSEVRRRLHENDGFNPIDVVRIMYERRRDKMRQQDEVKKLEDEVKKHIKNPDEFIVDLREKTKINMKNEENKKTDVDYTDVDYTDVDEAEKKLWEEFTGLSYWKDELTKMTNDYEAKNRFVKLFSSKPTQESVIVTHLASQNVYYDNNSYNEFASFFYKFGGGSVEDFENKYNDKEIEIKGKTYTIKFEHWSVEQNQAMFSIYNENNEKSKTNSYDSLLYPWRINKKDTLFRDGIGILLEEEEEVGKKGGKKRKTKRRMNMRKKQTKRKSKGKTRKVVKKNKKRATRRR